MLWIEEAGYVHLKFKDKLQPQPYAVNGGYRFFTYNVYSQTVNNIVVHKTKESLKQSIISNLKDTYESYKNRLSHDL